MKNQILIAIICLVFYSTTQGQVAINEDFSQPDASALLDVKGTDKGILIPRMTTTQRTNISSPATGLMVYDNTTNSFWYYSGSAWTELVAGIQTTLVDADNDTKIQVEKSADEDIIRMDLGGTEHLVFKKNSSGVVLLEVENTGFNTMLGREAGLVTDISTPNSTLGRFNTFIGDQTGVNNSTGYDNTFLGAGAGFLNTTGYHNVYLGKTAGFGNTSGSRNVFIGYQAGAQEAGSDKLYIDNSNTSSPLIYGDFANDSLNINGKLSVNSAYTFPTTDGTNGQLLSTDGSGTLSWTLPTWTYTNSDIFNANVGNVGIGVSPTKKLDVNGNGQFTADGIQQLTVKNTANNANPVEIYFDRTALGADQKAAIGVGDTARDFFIWHNGNDRLLINENGEVTINNLTTIRNTGTQQLLLENTANNTNPAQLTLSQSAQNLNYEIGVAQGRNFFIAHNGFDVINIDQNLGVGIGTSTPTQAALVVSNAGTPMNNSYAYFSYNGSAPVTGSGNFTGKEYSIWADANIAANEFHAVSDERIKNIKGISNGQKDLETLMQIEVTDYTFKDKIKKGDKSVKKVIAQQVAKVYPQAVKNNTTEVVPDIYQKASIEDGWIVLENDLKVGERVKIITETSNDIHEVTEVENNRFKVKQLATGNPQLATVFVYGREVNDFHTVDYEAISMLNVSATQQLAKKAEQLTDEVENLKKENAALKAQVDKINQLEAMLHQLQQQVNGTTVSIEK